MNLGAQNAFISRVRATQPDAGVLLAAEVDAIAMPLLLRLWDAPYIHADAEGFARALTADLGRLTDRPGVYAFVGAVAQEALRVPVVCDLLERAGYDPSEPDHQAALNRMCHRTICAHYVGGRLGIARDVAGWTAGVALVETVLEAFKEDDDLRLVRDYLHPTATAWDRIDPAAPFTPEVTQGLGELAVSELGLLLMMPNPKPLEAKRREAQSEETARRIKRLGDDLDRAQDKRWREQLGGGRLLPIGDWDRPVEDDPAASLETEELNAHVRAALTPDEARVLAARDSGLSWSAIARRFGMTRKVARRVAAQGRRSLRRLRKSF